MSLSVDRRNDPVWQARIDMAAALRWAVRYGLHEGICNHFSLQSPTSPEHFLINPQGLHWSEVTASDILVCDAKGNVIDGPHSVEPTAFFIHSRLHMGKPTAKCVLHTHMPYATALTLIEGGRLEPVSQNAMKFYGRIAYDDFYNGLALDADEGDRMCAKLSDDTDILFLASHGIIVTGGDVATAFDDLYYLERACMNQVMASMTGAKLRIIPHEIAARTRQQMDGETQQAKLHFAALKRILDREQPDYKT